MTITHRIFPHILAAVTALIYAWSVSATPYVKTGIEFVSPLAVLILVHLAWLGVAGRLQPGFSLLAIRRACTTALGMTIVVILVFTFGPSPVVAASDNPSIVWKTLIFVGCLFVVTLVVAIVAGILFAFVFAGHELFQWLKRRLGRPGSNDGRLYDLGAMAIALFALGIASLEGVVFSYSLPDRVSSTLTVAAPPERIWREVGRATSPNYPLPLMLKSIPQPMAVEIDEGAELGSRRVVRFAGREGEGNLVLQVVHRTNEEAVFEAVSDGSLISTWVRQRALTFKVEKTKEGSRLIVSLDYDRLLAPAWFFGPYIRLAAYLAVDVLARDTKERAEG